MFFRFNENFPRVFLSDRTGPRIRGHELLRSKVHSFTSPPKPMMDSHGTKGIYLPIHKCLFSLYTFFVVVYEYSIGINIPLPSKSYGLPSRELINTYFQGQTAAIPGILSRRPGLYQFHGTAAGHAQLCGGWTLEVVFNLGFLTQTIHGTNIFAYMKTHQNQRKYTIVPWILWAWERLLLYSDPF